MVLPLKGTAVRIALRLPEAVMTTEPAAMQPTDDLVDVVALMLDAGVTAVRFRGRRSARKAAADRRARSADR